MKPYTTIDEYIVQFSPEVQEKLQRIRKIAVRVIKNGAESIGYGIPVIDLDGKHVVFFAGYDKHVSIYPIPQGDKAFQKRIAPYVKGKGTLQFPLNKPIPYEIIKEVTELLFAQRVEENRK